jgi:hypothetical protein
LSPTTLLGWLSTTVRQSWGLILKFSGYEATLKLLQNLSHQSGSSNVGNMPGSSLIPPVWHHSVSGMLTNVVVGVLNCPPDVVKTRMQAQSPTKPLYTSTLDCCRKLLQEEGFSSFFRGSTLRVVRIGLGGGVQFGVYGAVIQWLNR